MGTEFLKIKESGVLKIGVRTNAPPFSNYNNGNPQGYVVELCNQIHQNLQKELNSKLQVKYLPVTSANRFEMIESGDIDIECGTTTVTKARRDKADFSFNTFDKSKSIPIIKKIIGKSNMKNTSDCLLLFI